LKKVRAANPHPVLTLEFLTSYVILRWEQPYPNAGSVEPGFTDADPQDKTFKSSLCTWLICTGPMASEKSWASAQQKQEDWRQPGTDKRKMSTQLGGEVAVNVLWAMNYAPALTPLFPIPQHRSPTLQQMLYESLHL